MRGAAQSRGMSDAISATPPQVLLIDDDVKLTRLLSAYLHEQGFSVTPVHDGQTGLARATSGGWDVVILDGMLPRLDGFEVLQRLRERSRVPVLMLTARGDERDRVFGLDAGADDYLPKTVSPRELASRLRALLRRAAPATVAPSIVGVGELKLDPDARTATLRDAAVPLTPVEFDLLLALARRADKVCSRGQLVEGLRDRSFDANDRSVDVHVAALRRKLGDDPREPRYIRTVRGAGYLLQS